jgi:hypothetical protein
VLYGAWAYVLFHWLMKWPLFGDSFCHHTRALMPAATFHIEDMIYRLDIHLRFPELYTNDGSFPFVLLLVRQALRFILETGRILVENRAFCGT